MTMKFNELRLNERYHDVWLTGASKDIEEKMKLIILDEGCGRSLYDILCRPRSLQYGKEGED